MPGDVDLDDLPYEDLSDDVELEMKKERESRKRRELLAKVDFSRYTGSQSVGWLAQLFSQTADEDVKSKLAEMLPIFSGCIKTLVFMEDHLPGQPVGRLVDQIHTLI